MLRLLCNKSDMIFSLNGQTTSYLQPITDTPIRQIPNFITVGELAEGHEIREELKSVLYVGGLVKNKGVGECLEIASRMPDIVFKFVGKGDPCFEEEARKRGLGNVVFLGSKDRPEVKAELQQADIFLFMTHFLGEGFSNALCEAMAAGLPCVVTDWAANADMIGEKGGFVVPVKGVEQAVAAIEKLKDKQLRSLCSASNIEKVKTQYVEPVVLDQYVEAYNWIANQPTAKE